MDLRTRYLGLELAHPLVAGASPLVDDLALVDRLAAAGAAAIVMHSLFEEQVSGDARARERFLEAHGESHAEAQRYSPRAIDYALGPIEYLEQIGRIRKRTGVPVIASLNGTTLGSWLSYARAMQEAGASAIELNLYDVVTDACLRSSDIETRSIEVVRAVRESVTVPIAVKLSPFYTSLPAFARALVDAGADGLVLFNRFYQPDIDVENLEAEPVLRLSDGSELLLRLRWLAILSPQVACSLAASGGVHEATDAVKAIMAGAHCVQLVSSLLRHGPERLGTTLSALRAWLEEHEYDSMATLRGSMDHSRCPDPRAFERANYVQILQSYRPEVG